MYGKLISSSMFKGRKRQVYVDVTAKGKVVMKFHGEGRYASVSIGIDEQVLNEMFDALVSIKAFIGGNKEALK